MKELILIYLAAVSLLSMIICIYDKLASKKRPRGRIRERTLFILSALGGAAAMYLTMILIRHKTKHRSFMWGLPAIIAAQLIFAAAIGLIFFK